MSQLLLDAENARLGSDVQTQPEIELSLARKNPGQILRLAEGIAKNGLDPTALPAVMPTPDRMKKYVVLERNRRILALKALDTPALIYARSSSADGQAPQ